MAIDVETRKPKLSNVLGGLSGPAIRPIAVRMVWECHQAVKLPIIGMGGIATPEDALEFLIAGASAVQVGTANFVDPFIWTKLIDGLVAVPRPPPDRAAWRISSARCCSPDKEPAWTASSSRSTSPPPRKRSPWPTRCAARSAASKSATSSSRPPVRTIVRTLVDRGDRVFLDLKFHDIPNTVAGAVAAAAALGVWMVNVHASGGRAMLAAAQARCGSRRRPRTGARAAGHRRDGADQPRRAGARAAWAIDARRSIRCCRLARLAQSAGLDGVVASPQETGSDPRQACGPDFVIVTPGIRGGSARPRPDDQQRTMTPAAAVAAGGSYLVVGRPITAAADPRAAAERIAADVRSADDVRSAELQLGVLRRT